jgi:outer membrane protein assembly factor BamB
MKRLFSPHTARILLRACALVASLACGGFLQPAHAQTVPAADAWRIGWPTANGPTGNGMPLRTDTPLVADMAQARLAWISEDNSIGSAKTGSQTWANSERVEQHIGPDAKTTKGNWAGVVVTDGRVYASSWRPSGKVYTAPYKTNKPYQKGPTPEVPTRFRVEAEDLVICFDANTGKVLWKTAEPGGLIRAGGKRGGFQVAPAVDGGRVFSVGSTGRLFAHDAKTGKQLWQSDVGGAHKAAVKEKAEAIATAESGKIVIPDAPGWFNSVVVADGVVIVSDFGGPSDAGLRGHDAATGQLLWELPKIISRYATPNVWRHKSTGDKAWLLTATSAGTLQLIDPKTGKLAWQVKGLGQNWTTLGPGQDTVMVNVKPTAKRVGGIWGAYRITPEKAELAWKMADEPRNEFSTWMDNGAQQQAFVRDGRVLLRTEGSRDIPDRTLLLDEKDGRELAESGGTDGAKLTGLILWLGDTALVRSDHSHGASHGGRKPILRWFTEPGKLQPELDNGKPGGIDLVDFDTAYEVLMGVPLVDGRMFERLDDGRLACYDLRAPKHSLTWSGRFDGVYPGMPPVDIRLWADRERVSGAKVWIPDSAEAGLPLGTVRRKAVWERCGTDDLKVSGDTIRGTMLFAYGTHTWPVQIDLRRDGSQFSGTWSRKIPALPQTQSIEGTIVGRADDRRIYPTPWFKESPWTEHGKNPPGTRTWVLQLDRAIPLRGEPKGLALCLDHDGKRWVRAGGTAFQYSQAWDDVDATALKLEGDRITGTAMVVANIDPYLDEKAAGIAGAAGRITIDASASSDGTIQGTYKALWGEEWKSKGPASGTVNE